MKENGNTWHRKLFKLTFLLIFLTFFGACLTTSWWRSPSTMVTGDLPSTPVALQSDDNSQENFNQITRHNILESECLRRQSYYEHRKISLAKWYRIPVPRRPRLFMSDKYKFVVCATAKCGTTQWRNLIMTLEGDSHARSFALAIRKRLLWNIYGRIEAEKKMNEYYRVMVVREPLERLVSAYRDKLQTETSEFSSLSRKIHKIFGDGSAGVATFSEFVDYILADRTPASGVNVHWKLFSVACDPCMMNYDYIAKLETIAKDFDDISEKIGIDRTQAFNGSLSQDLNKKWQYTYRSYYDNLTDKQRTAIFHRYKSEYDYFGYLYPNFIKSAVDD